MIRFLSFSVAGLFAGIAGGLTAINFELMNAINLSGAQSGVVLLMAYIGGIGHFFGPILGAIVVTLLQSMLSDYRSDEPTSELQSLMRISYAVFFLTIKYSHL